MADCTTETKNLVHALTKQVVNLIEVNYLPEDMAPCAQFLVPLYQARAFRPLPQDVERTIERVECAVAARPHWACGDCNALFHDTDDLGAVTEVELELLDPGQVRPIGTCPVCGGDVHPQQPEE